MKVNNPVPTRTPAREESDVVEHAWASARNTMKSVPELEKFSISRSNITSDRQRTGVFGDEWTPVRPTTKTEPKETSVSNELRKLAAETAQKTERMCDRIDAERKRDSEKLAQALKDLESEKAARMAVESRLNEEVGKRSVAEDREKLVLERCAALEKRVEELESQKSGYLSKEIVVKQEVM